MEQPPKTVQIGPYQYRVLMDADAQTSLRGHSPDAVGAVAEDACVGMTDTHNLTILLDPTMAPMAIRATFAHELIHALADLCGLGDEDEEEAWANRMGPQLCDVLRRNPEVVAYLTGE